MVFDLLLNAVISTVIAIIITPLALLVLTPYILIKCIFGPGRYREKVVFLYKKNFKEWMRSAFQK